MTQDTYYYTPRLPMFIMMEEFALARVCAIKYEEGKISAVLADWDCDNLQNEFYGTEHFFDNTTEPFYCFYRNEADEIMYQFVPLKEWVEREFETTNYAPFFTPDKILYDLMNDIEKLHIPVFNSKKEAQDYVFAL